MRRRTFLSVLTTGLASLAAGVTGWFTGRAAAHFSADEANRLSEGWEGRLYPDELGPRRALGSALADALQGKGGLMGAVRHAEERWQPHSAPLQYGLPNPAALYVDLADAATADKWATGIECRLWDHRDHPVAGEDIRALYADPGRVARHVFAAFRRVPLSPTRADFDKAALTDTLPPFSEDVLLLFVLPEYVPGQSPKRVKPALLTWYFAARVDPDATIIESALAGKIGTNFAAARFEDVDALPAPGYNLIEFKRPRGGCYH